MAGHVRQHGGSWEVRISAGRHPDGRRRMITRSAPTREAAEALRHQLLADPQAALRAKTPRSRPAPQAHRRRQAPRRAAGPYPWMRWPLEPLLAVTNLPNVRALERAAGLTSGAGRRWEHRGLTDETADRVAVALGRHPAEVWPDWADRWLVAEQAARRAS